jgi:non-specific serine/threonine protein kinase
VVRRRRVRGNAAAVSQITHRLDGIPLAIELAAARVKALSVDVIAVRLDDQFRLLTGGNRTGLPRQQTLRATLDWSHNLLSEPERILLRRLSLFAGGFTLEAAEQICSGKDVDDSDVLGLVTRLIDKSLVVFVEQDGQSRYRLLGTVCQYGREHLQEAGEAYECHKRHRDWYLALAESATADLWRGRQSEIWLSRLEQEHDNFRVALEWTQSDEDGVEVGMRLAGALHWFWFRRGHWGEGQQWLERALARNIDATPSSALATALYGATNFAWRRGDYGLARSLGEKGLALSRRLGNKEACCWFLFQLSIIEDDFQRARTMLDEWSQPLSRVGQQLGAGLYANSTWGHGTGSRRFRTGGTTPH